MLTGPTIVGPRPPTVRIWRSEETRTYLLYAATLSYAFTAAAFRSDYPSIYTDPEGLLRLSIPVLAALAGLSLRDISTRTADRPPHAAALDVISAFALSALAELILYVVKPGLVLPRWAPTQGGFVGISLVAATRSLFPPRAKLASNMSSISAQEVVWMAEELGNGTARIVTAYLVASALFICAALYFILADGARFRTAAGTVLTGTVYLVYRIHVFRSRPKVDNAIDSFRNELRIGYSFSAAPRIGTTGRCSPVFCLRSSDPPSIHTGSRSSFSSPASQTIEPGKDVSAT